MASPRFPSFHLCHKLLQLLPAPILVDIVGTASVAFAFESPMPEDPSTLHRAMQYVYVRRVQLLAWLNGTECMDGKALDVCIEPVKHIRCA